MNNQESAALQKLLTSKNYKDVCPDAVARVFREALARCGNVKSADKAARTALHQLTGAFMTPDQMKTVRRRLAEGRVDEALSMHSSTRERPSWRETYGEIFSVTGQPGSVLDLACGLNPICLGELGISVTGMDVNGGVTSLINDWASENGRNVRCECVDLLGKMTFPPADMALMMKLLPVLERQQSGAGAALITRVLARWKLVTFPTRTLGGRNVGMDRQYSEWMISHLPADHRIVRQFTRDDELYFILEDKNA